MRSDTKLATKLNDAGLSVKHPAKFSDAILVEMGRLIPSTKYRRVLDPFAGVGRIHQLPNETVGVEIEAEWAGQHPDTICGDSTHLVALFKQGTLFDAICTSPVYGNRMSDHHNATDDSERHTYRHYLGRELHENNAGQMHFPHPSYLALHEEVWRQATAMLRIGGRFVLNVKDFVADKTVRPVSGWHATTLCRLGLRLVSMTPVAAPGHRHGQNHGARVDHEWVLCFVKEQPPEPSLFDGAAIVEHAPAAPEPRELTAREKRNPVHVEPQPNTMRWWALETIATYGPMSDVSLAQMLDRPVNAVSPRRKELADQGYIGATEDTAHLPRGQARLWVVTRKGRDLLATGVL